MAPTRMENNPIFPFLRDGKLALESSSLTCLVVAQFDTIMCLKLPLTFGGCQFNGPAKLTWHALGMLWRKAELRRTLTVRVCELVNC